MDDRLRVRVLRSVADLQREPEAFIDRERRIADVVGDRTPIDQFHREERPARPRLPIRDEPRVEHAGDIRMIQQLKGAPLGVEPAQDRGGVHPGLDDLQRNTTLDGARLQGPVDDPETTLTDLFFDFVGADLLGHPERRQA